VKFENSLSQAPKLPTNGKSSHILGDSESTHVWGDSPCMGGLPVDGETPHMWGDSPYMRRLHIYWESPHIWEDFQKMGRLPMDVESLHVCGDSPYTGGLPTCGKTSHMAHKWGRGGPQKGRRDVVISFRVLAPAPQARIPMYGLFRTPIS
jgi:hypothetical protein